MLVYNSQIKDRLVMISFFSPIFFINFILVMISDVHMENIYWVPLVIVTFMCNTKINYISIRSLWCSRLSKLWRLVGITYIKFKTWKENGMKRLSFSKTSSDISNKTYQHFLFSWVSCICVCMHMGVHTHDCRSKCKTRCSALRYFEKWHR